MERPPKDAVASVIGYRKGKSTIAIARQCAGRDRNCAGEHCWARGSAVSTVGVELEQVRASIRTQEEADGAGRFEPLHRNRPPLRRSYSSSHRLCRGCLTIWLGALAVGMAVGFFVSRMYYRWGMQR